MRFTWAMLSLTMLAGCSGGGGSTKASAPKPSPVELKGIWKAMVDPSGADKNDPRAVSAINLALQFEGMNDLEFSAEDRYTLCAGGFLIEGTAEKGAEDVELTPETINGLPIASGGQFVQERLMQPMNLAIEENRLALPAGEYGEQLVYHRWRPAPEGATKGDPLAGAWSAKELAGITESHTSRGFDYVLRRTKLNLRKYGRFDLRLVFHFEGTWTRQGSTLTLKHSTGSLKGSVRGDVIMLSSPDGKVSVALARSG